MVLREKVALRRLQRDNPEGVNPEGGPPQPPNQPGPSLPGPSQYRVEPGHDPLLPPRGTKRQQDDGGAPSEKRPAV